MNSEPSVGSKITPSETNYILLGTNVVDKKKIIESLKLTTHEGIVKDAKRSEKYLVSGADIGHSGVAVETTGEYIEEMIRFAEKRKRMQVLGMMKHLDTKIRSADVDALYQHGGDAWRDFCSDIVDYYCFRFRVFKIPMPICVNESSSSE